MNAAARAINQSNLFSGHLFAMQISKKLWAVLILLCMVLISAISVIYMANETRTNFNTLQQFEQQGHDLQVQWGQFLLEQASLEAPARVEELAVEKLKMHLPYDNQTFILQVR